MARLDHGFVLYPERRLWGEEISFHLARYERGQRQRAVLSFEDLKEGEEFGPPTFYLSVIEAQSLIDRLWDAGLRPSQGKQSEGVMSAQGAHLEDMRAIAFAKLSVERPR